MDKKILYHGSDKIVKQPMFGVGKEDNDYGSGFYVTEDIDKAREWAWINGGNGAYCNQYEVDLRGLVISELDKYGPLAWIAEVASHRGMRAGITDEISSEIIRKYKVDLSYADIIVGYRADDSYISVIEAFFKKQLSVDEVERMFRQGNMGQQMFIKSPKAFEALRFVGAERLTENKDYGNAEIKARRDVSRFLANREKAINMEGYCPYGILVRDAIQSTLLYNGEYDYYEPVDDRDMDTDGSEEHEYV